MENIYDTLKLKQVINASGKMTILGVSKVSDAVAALQKEAGQSFFVMEELMIATGAYLAKQLKVEDAQIVASASAGIAQSVAAVIGQGCTRHLYEPYNTDIISKREIVIPKGHNVDYGTPVELMVEQGGGVVREAGYANMCSASHIRRKITEKTAAILYVKSHHAVQKSMLTVVEAAEIAKAHDLPLIVDAAAEEDVFKYTEAGADLVIYSGAKAFEGPSSGLVIGKKKYIEWVRLQSKGIGRAMKIGKENVLGLTQAITDYLHVGGESGESMKKRLAPFVSALTVLDKVTAQVVQDASGRDIYRLRITAENADVARMIVAAQMSGNPAIYTRDYQVNAGMIDYDIRAVDETEMGIIVNRLKEILENIE